MQKPRKPKRSAQPSHMARVVGEMGEDGEARGTGLRASRVTINRLPSQRKPQRWHAVKKSFLASHKRSLRLKSIR